MGMGTEHGGEGQVQGQVLGSGAGLQAGLSEAARMMGSRKTRRKAEAARANGARGGRPRGARKPLGLVECKCGAGDSMQHKSTCPKGRAIRRRLAAGQPLEGEASST